MAKREYEKQMAERAHLQGQLCFSLLWHLIACLLTTDASLHRQIPL
jgi:hypothetical protein